MWRWPARLPWIHPPRSYFTMSRPPVSIHKRADVVNKLIRQLQREVNVTSVVVTHDMKSAAAVGDRILMLWNGRFIADGHDRKRSFTTRKHTFADSSRVPPSRKTSRRCRRDRNISAWLQITVVVLVAEPKVYLSERVLSAIPILYLGR